MRSPVAMTAIASQRERMREWSDTGIESEIEMEDEFCAVMKRIKTENSYENTKPFDDQLATLPQDYIIQKSDECSDLSTVIPQFTKDIHPSLHCRLCATPDNDMTDIFGFGATGNSILEMINNCLPVMVKHTDTLPKQICLFCLGELERCYRFHETVLKAETQFLAFEKLVSIKLEEAERNDETAQPCNTQSDFIEYNNIDGSSEKSYDVEMSNKELPTITEEAETADATVKSNVLLPIIKPCSVLLSRIQLNCKNNSDLESERKSSSDSELEKPDPSTEASDPRATTASENIRQSTCDPEISGLRSGKRVDPARVKKADLAIPERVPIRNQLYRCTVCAKLYTTQGNLNQHNRIHTTEGLYDCEYCGKNYTSRAHRDRHHRIHMGERPFKCPICKKTFLDVSYMKRHALIHSGTRSYSCSLCNKSFKTSADTRRHIFVHTAGKPWECDVCEKKYKTKEALRRHVAKHHKPDIGRVQL